MARALLLTLSCPEVKEGRREDITPVCAVWPASGLITNGQIYCAVNPKIGRELENRYINAPQEQKKVLVAGGGIGGMQAALEASRRGHKVILCEKSDRLGGALKCEEHVPFKAKVKAYIEHQVREISRAAVDVRLNTEVTPELAKSLEPDVLIAALGARPVKPDITGIEGKNVLSAEEAYYNSAMVGKRVAVLGGGLVGTELAIYLAGLGRDVTIIELMPLNSGGNILHQNALNVEIERYNIAYAATRPRR